MGQSYGAICKQCGHAFQACEGGGFFFHLLHCEQCGKEKSVTKERMGSTFGKSDREEQQWADKHVKRCSCGGRFTFQAKARCPRCRSPELDVDPDVGTMCYD